MRNHDIFIKPLDKEEEIEICAGLMAFADPWKTLRIPLSQIKDTLRDDFYESYVAYVGEQIAGVAIIQMKGVCTGYLKSIAVKKEYRRQHIGSLLMDHIEERIFSVHKNVFLFVSSFNENAKRFYRRRGYEVIGIVEDYVLPGYDEILMRKRKN